MKSFMRALVTMFVVAGMMTALGCGRMKHMGHGHGKCEMCEKAHADAAHEGSASGCEVCCEGHSAHKTEGAGAEKP